MRSREACERRVYRLAALVTGSPHAAAAVMEAVLASRPDVRDLDGVHLDRLALLRSREVAPATLTSERVTFATAQRLAALPAQQREAWVLARVYATPPRDAARSMDCSFHAFQQHLQAADAAMARSNAAEVASVSPVDSAAAFRTLSGELEVPEVHRRRRARKEALRRIMLAAVILFVVLAAIVATVIW